LGKRFGKSTSVGLGRYTDLILKTVTAVGDEKKKTRIIRISEPLYEKFKEHSQKYYNIETYETILENLLDCFDKNNEDVRWWNNNK
jgi:hypothetical protein